MSDINTCSHTLYSLASIKRGVRIAVWVVSIVDVTLMIATLLAVIFQCDPVAYNWDFTIPGGTCTRSIILGATGMEVPLQIITQH